MLELDVSEVVELLLITVLGITQNAKRIEAAEGSLGTDLCCKISRESGAGLAGLGRSKSGGADKEGGEDNTLHCYCFRLGLRNDIG